MTLVEKSPKSAEANIFLELAQKLQTQPVLYAAAPLSEEQMELFMRGERLSHTTTTISKHTSAPVIPAVPAQPSATKKRALSDPFSRVPLYGCAYRGAIDLAVHIKDAAILGHAAINGFTSYGRRGLYERGILYPAFVPRQFENTDITINEAVYGGVEQTRRKAFQMVKRGIRNIITVTSCIPGMSGDDLVPLQKELKSLGVDMYIIHTDGIEAGDYNEGMALCYKTLALQAVDPNVKPEPDCINLVYEHTISSQTDRTFMNLQEIFKRIGIRINCRFICAESMENIHNFLKAPYSIMARYDKLGHELQKIFEEKLSLFDSISVREKELADMINSLNINKKAVICMDPVFLKSKLAWKEYIADTDININFPYILVFIMGVSKQADYIVRRALEVGKKNNCQVILIGDQERWYKYRQVKHFGVATPREFIKLIDSAKCVFTNSFHATAFSIILNSSFYTEMNISNNGRIESLLNLAGLESRKMYDGKLNSLYTTKINWDIVTKKLQPEIEKSKKFLQVNL